MHSAGRQHPSFIMPGTSTDDQYDRKAVRGRVGWPDVGATWERLRRKSGRRLAWTEGPCAYSGGPAEEAGGSEEAVAARLALAPCARTRADCKAHEATHSPFRSWCAECIKGRADNPPHRSVPGVEEERRRLPELHFDYAFLRREASDELLTLVVMEARPARAVRTWAVPHKGVADADAVERVYRGSVRPASARRVSSSATTSPQSKPCERS